MQATVHAGAILIKDSVLLPKEFPIEREPCVPRWKLVKGLGGRALDRLVRQAGWTFFCLAGEIRVIVLGIDERSMAHRAINRIVTNPKAKEFNSLEITRVVTKRLLGVSCMSVGAQLRHIQEGMFLFSAGRIQEPDSAILTDSHLEQTIKAVNAEGLPDPANGHVVLAAPRVL